MTRPGLVVYLAGKMTGEESWGFPLFDRAAEWLRSIGWEVVSPADMDREHGFDGTGPLPEGWTLEECLRRDFQALTACDAIVLLPGWEDSTGARKELRVALDIRLKLYVLRDAPMWDLGDLDPLSSSDARQLLDGFVTDQPPAVSDEVRVVDPETGGAKGQKLAQLGAVCPKALMEVAKVAGFGSAKYDRYNFLKGYRFSLSYDACQRHLHAFWAGEDSDPESGLYHLAHAAWHCLAMLAFVLRGKGTDDRPLNA